MIKEKSAFVDEKEFHEISGLLESWKVGPQHIKHFFLKVTDKLATTEDTALNFISRPGISYSLRACLKSRYEKDAFLFALVDIIDDDPENRWLSICFYTEMVTDPDELGNLVLNGILGKDGYCFDLYEDDDSMISYIEQRIEEAHSYIQRKSEATTKP